MLVLEGVLALVSVNFSKVYQYSLRPVNHKYASNDSATSASTIHRHPTLIFMLPSIVQSTNINSSIGVSISININDNILCSDESAKPMFVNTPRVYKHIWA